MRKLLMLFAWLLLVSGYCLAQNRGFGLGVILGEPTGVSAKAWLSARNAFDLGLAWSVRHDGFFHLHGDYLWHFPDAIRSTERFVPYLGLGGRFGARSHNALLGIRFVGGLAWWPRNAPIDVFAEIAPIMDLAPETELSANGGIGIRYYFY